MLRSLQSLRAHRPPTWPPTEQPVQLNWTRRRLVDRPRGQVGRRRRARQRNQSRRDQKEFPHDPAPAVGRRVSAELGGTGRGRCPPTARPRFSGAVTRTLQFHRNRNPPLERDDFFSNRHPALAYWWSMIFSENRDPPVRRPRLLPPPRRSMRRSFHDPWTRPRGRSHSRAMDQREPGVRAIPAGRAREPAPAAAAGGAMTASWPACAAIAVAALLLQPTGRAEAEALPLPSGWYEITSRLELPHLERWAIDRTARVCLSGSDTSGAIPVPVLSANAPFATCTATNVTAGERHAGVRHRLSRARRRQGPRGLCARSRQVRRPRRHGHGRKEHDDDGGAARQADRGLRTGGAKLGGPVLITGWRARSPRTREDDALPDAGPCG